MALAPLFAFSLLVHALVAWRLLPDLAQAAPAYVWLFGIWLAISTVLMPMGMVALRFARAPLAHVLTWAGLLCMGLFSSLFVLTLVRDLLLLTSIGMQWIAPGWLDTAFLRSVSAQLVVPVALAMTLVGFWNARRTASVVRVDVPIANLPDALVGFSVAQISDIHMGATIQQPYLARIVARVNALQADLVAITGDLVDGPVHALGPLVDPLKDLHSTHGTFFVTGNHEYYSGAQGWIAKLRSLGILVLMNEHVVIAHGSLGTPSSRVLVAGVTDYSAHHFDSSQQSDPQRALEGTAKPVDFKLLLAHQPRSADAADVRAMTCNSQATPMVASSGPGVTSCVCNNRLPLVCID
jgi:predicted MPP superfamily phosphohydrolase